MSIVEKVRENINKFKLLSLLEETGTRCLPQAEETARENSVRFMRPDCATDNQALNEYDASMTQIFKIGLQFAPKSGTIGG